MKLVGDYNVVGDVTGYGKTLEALIKKMPQVPLIGLGDLIDRGPNSKLVLDIFMDRGWQSVKGNHDHMMWYQKYWNNPDCQRRLYPDGCWFWNGGVETAKSFDAFVDGVYPGLDVDKVEQKYWDFIESMPLKIEVNDKFILTHAPIGYCERNFFDIREINRDERLLDRSALWNRNGPYAPSKKHPYEGLIQLYGHNSPKNVLWHTKKHPNGIYREQNDPTDPPWAICMDTWRSGFLSGIHLPTLEVYRQEIVD